MYYALFYEKRTDYAQRQVPLQAAHLEYVEAAICRGDIILAGSLADPDDGTALILFDGDAKLTAESFAKGDPYVIHEVVNRWYVRAWHTLVCKDPFESQTHQLEHGEN